MGSAFLPRISLATEADVQTVYDCIIIGAGPSGLTAARQLSQTSVHGAPLKILVLEGSNRIGGRMFTDRSLINDFGSAIEQGAEYIHVAPGIAPIWDEVHRYQLETKSYPKLLKGYLYNSEYLAPTPHSPLYSIGHLNFKILKSYHIFKDILNYDGPDISGATFMRRLGYDGFTAESAEALLTGHLGSPLNKVSMKGFVQDHLIAQLKGSHEYYVLGGYDSILRGMAQDISTQKILLNHPVNKIRRSQRNLIQAQVPGIGWFTAKSMLCTASIGMLQSHNIDFGEFWTSQKEQALNYVIPAHQIKLSVRFKTRFWPQDMCMLNQLEKSERKAGKTYFVPHYKEEDKPPILTALISGDDAKKLMPLSSKEIMQVVISDLDRMFKTPTPINKKIAQKKDGSPIFTCKKWSEDPFAKGGISYLQVSEHKGSVSVQNARAVLGQATQPLFWAGEATSLVQQPASVHGAHSTGLRAFSEIYNYLKMI